VVQRAQALLLAGKGVSDSEISDVVGISRPTVLAWRRQFEKDGLVGFGDVAKGRGRKPSISADFHAGSSPQGLGGLEAVGASIPPGHGFSGRAALRGTGV
jgi:hypothetical protein